MLLGVFGKLYKLVDYLVSKFAQLGLGYCAKGARQALLVEVLDEDSLDSKLSPIHRVLKVFNLFAEHFLKRTLIRSLHIFNLLSKFRLHLRPSLIVPDKLR